MGRSGTSLVPEHRFLVSVFFLNISNNALWISYSSVADVTADYYEKEVPDSMK
jgi:hypothetical protein